MTRLIDADAVKYEPLPKGERNYRTYNLDDAYDDGYDDAMFDINHMPTIDAMPIVETTLIIRKLGSFEEVRCSNCKQVWLWSGELFIFNYCPECGAKVVGKRYKKKEES